VDVKRLSAKNRKRKRKNQRSADFHSMVIDLISVLADEYDDNKFVHAANVLGAEGM
jgi:hypothetical protein